MEGPGQAEEEKVLETVVYVDHVSPLVEEGSAKMMESNDVSTSPRRELEDVFVLEDPSLPGMLRDETCTRVRNSRGGLFKHTSSLQCRLFMGAALRWLNIQPEFRLGAEQESSQLAFRDGVHFHLTSNLSSVSRVAEAAMIRELSKIGDMPLEAEVKELNLELKSVPNAKSIQVEARPVMTAVLSSEMLEGMLG